MGIRTDLLVTEEIAESSDLRATPFEFERAKRVEAALSILEGKWKIVILNGSSRALSGDSLSLNAPSPAFHNVCWRNSCVSLRSASW
jgi:hypothetical protein